MDFSCHAVCFGPLSKVYICEDNQITKCGLLLLSYTITGSENLIIFGDKKQDSSTFYVANQIIGSSFSIV